jgi:hypothetical protein
MEGNQTWSTYGNRTYFGYLWSPTVHWFDGSRTTFWLPSDGPNFTMFEVCRMATKQFQSLALGLMPHCAFDGDQK